MGSGKWTSLFWGGRGVGPSGFGSSSTADQVTEGIDAGNLTAIVTGATSGIGIETARVLALRGANVIIPCRRLDSGLKLQERILEENPNARIEVMEMDLSSLDSVESFARCFCSSHEHLNILINNAGIFACPFQLSVDGVELQFATNYLGHFLLTDLLLDKMKTTAKKTGRQGRIVNVSTFGHTRNFDESWFDLNKINDRSKYDRFGAYSHSKLGNIWHASELSRCLQEEGCNVTANSLHPGVIATNLTRFMNLKQFTLESIAFVFKLFIKTIPQGAATSCYVALHPAVRDVTGKYFVDCDEALPSLAARDKELSRKFWNFTKELLVKLRKANAHFGE
ncbi:uncharacterized protein A4U43_C04F27450 [Asparagus officinalis]|uniref:Uncharacterized protein n=1 Tax=Asparagus officinalis TaxID=4686 RepID=A0A5P1F8N7_ASPOF|nr:short-chain dehydrogenase TIC 32, chloroplastic-like [Asparagus officinalis]ONK73119.1 uncharacterized protein A4U43_C04F27450 [Asparagus officinalis]